MSAAASMSAPLYDGPVIDAHHHVWEPERGTYPWLRPEAAIPFRYGDYTAIKRRYLPPEFRDEAAGVPLAATVYMEAEWDPADPLGETAYVHDVAKRFDLPNAIVAQAWLDREDAAEVIAKQASFPLVRSVRHKPEGAKSPAEARAGVRTLMSDERWRRGYADLARYNLHFDLQTPWWNLAEGAELARDFPETTIIVNHAGVPGDREPETLRGWRAGMEALSRHENVVVKVSGIGERDHPWTVERNREVVDTILGLFGGGRAMFGSNFPVDGLCASYRTIFDGIRRIASTRSAADQHDLFFETARRVYRPLKGGVPLARMGDTA